MAGITRCDPFAEAGDLRETMDRLFDRGFSRPWRLMTWENSENAFPVELSGTEEEVIVKASLPSVKSEDLQISVTGDTLIIKGETQSDQEEKQQDFYRRERRFGAFQRSFTLPSKVDADQAQASFDNGVVTLQLPKVPEVRPKTIQVKAKPTLEADQN
jgi:HSP20 family protein